MCSSLLRLQGWLSVSYGNRSQLYCGVSDGGLGHSLQQSKAEDCTNQKHIVTADAAALADAVAAVAAVAVAVTGISAV